MAKNSGTTSVVFNVTYSGANKIYLLKGVLGIGWKCKWFIENIHF